jgi:hypothetical protein
MRISGGPGHRMNGNCNHYRANEACTRGTVLESQHILWKTNNIDKQVLNKFKFCMSISLINVRRIQEFDAYFSHDFFWCEPVLHFFLDSNNKIGWEMTIFSILDEKIKIIQFQTCAFAFSCNVYEIERK